MATEVRPWHDLLYLMDVRPDADLNISSSAHLYSQLCLMLRVSMLRVLFSVFVTECYSLILQCIHAHPDCLFDFLHLHFTFIVHLFVNFLFSTIQ